MFKSQFNRETSEPRLGFSVQMVKLEDGLPMGCPRQNLSDGEGRELAVTVEFFSKNQGDWYFCRIVQYLLFENCSPSNKQGRAEIC